MGKRVSFTTKSGKKVSFTTKAKKAGSRIKKRIKSRSKSIKRSVRSRSPVAKHKSKSRPGKKSIIDRIPVLRNKTVQKVAFGLGMGALVIQGINLIARFAPSAIAQPLQQNQRIIKLATEFATEPISGIVDLVMPMLGGQSNGGGGMSMGNQAGFA